MAHRLPTKGLGGYFHHIAFDIDTNIIREKGNRAYIEYRIWQVEGWLALLNHKLSKLPDTLRAHSAEGMSLTMDLAYLLAVRQALMESLPLTPTS